MTERIQIAFIGGGMMSEAIISAIIDNKDVLPVDMIVGELLEERREYLSSNYGIATVASNVDAINGAQMVVLAVKPQHLQSVMVELRGHILPSQTVVSIIAGATTNTIVGGLGHQAVIRVMPNTPARIGHGMTVWTSSPVVSNGHIDITKTILSALGQEIYVAEEKYLDMATALSASGPAYVFLFIEGLIDAGVGLGLTREMASALAVQTVYGSINLLMSTGDTPSDLRNMVTSPGGTTAAALSEFERRGFRGTVIDAVVKAYEKAIDLGKQQ